MTDWSWSAVLAGREFWPLHFGTFAPFGVARDDASVRALAEALFFVETVKRIPPAEDAASLEVVRGFAHGPARAMVLRHLAIAKLPRKRIYLFYPGGYCWRIEYGPQGSVSHHLESRTISGSLEVASYGAHSSSPALRLAEWERMVTTLVEATIPREYVPLLLFAAVGDSDPFLAERRLLAHAGALLDSLGVADPSHFVTATFEPSLWHHKRDYGWVSRSPSSVRNPRGDRAGASWRKLARETHNPEHQMIADELQSSAWRPTHEFRALRRFFETIGVPPPT